MIECLGYTVDPETGTVFGLRGQPIGRSNADGYLRVNRRGKHITVHRLVWQAVHGPVPPGLQINHINGDKRDNRIQNLECVTQEENIRHAYRTGLISHAGERNSSSRLTSADVAVIRRRRANGETGPALAAEYGVTHQSIYNVCNRRTWAEVA